MKRIVLLIVTFLLSSAVCITAGAEACYKLPNEAYYHMDPKCRFGAENPPYSDGDTAVYASENDAIATGARPCPGCASSHEPTFSGNFPKGWNADIQPWALGTPETWLPKKVRSTWGDVSARINEFVKGTYEPATDSTHASAYPKDYGGIFRNACGGYTLLMVDSNPEKIDQWKKALGCNFWVLNADYSMNDLISLNNAISDIMVAEPENRWKIVGCGIGILKVGGEGFAQS